MTTDPTTAAGRWQHPAEAEVERLKMVLREARTALVSASTRLPAWPPEYCWCYLPDPDKGQEHRRSCVEKQALLAHIDAALREEVTDHA